MLYPLSYIRWCSEPQNLNDTRRAMASVGAPDRRVEPEPQFEGTDLDASGSLREDWPRATTAIGPARHRCAGSIPGARCRSVSEACPAVPRLISGERNRSPRHRRALLLKSSPRRTGGSEVIRIVKERPGTNVRPGSGRKKTPVKLRACRGLLPGGRAGCPKTASLQVDVWRLTSWAPSAAGERSRHDLRNADRANRSRKK